ncbi:MAG: cysteine--tRNA ligase [Phycisphaeraceae bacterium]|nr:cysteine--tRNA ligase [Phycisphaeraceae bacterium]
MPQLRFHNTLTGRVEPFQPIEPGKVSMYNCGPTVYDFAHIGNFRAFLMADLLRRTLELSGLKVHQVMNITDVGHMTQDDLADGGGEDKMQAAARRLKEAKKSGQAPVDNPDDPYQVAEYFIHAFLEDAKALRLKIADDPRNDKGIPQNMPRATEHVGRMIEIILRLVENGHAYRASDGCVYYDVQSFPDYGKLSGNTLDKLRGGAGGRVQDEHQAVKKHPADFLLWKPDPTHIMKWDPRKWEAPWGVGYPGWHIECSAMARTALGRDVIDIHTGGEDNIFPHHECEIAQSRGATGQPAFARLWLHTRFLRVEGEKMSKSKGNFFTVRDVLDGRITGRQVDPAVLRYELLKTHYRKNADFTRKGLEDSASAIRRLREAASGDNVTPVAIDHPDVQAFFEPLADDLNIAGALAVVFERMQKADDQLPGVLRRIDDVLGVLPTSQADDSDATALCKQLDAARAARDFAAADAIRKQLIEAGYDVKTTKDGTVATKKLA